MLVSGVQHSDSLQECVYMSTHVCIYMYIASVVVTHRLSSCRSRALEHRLSSCGARAYCPEACRIVPDQELNLCLLLWQADSLLLNHQGSPGPQLFRWHYVLPLFFKWILLSQLFISCPLQRIYIVNTFPNSESSISFYKLFFCMNILCIIYVWFTTAWPLGDFTVLL